MFRHMKTGECISFQVLVSWTICHSEVETGEEECPSGLARIQTLDFSKIFEVTMICNNFDLMVCSLQLVSPFFESHLDSQQFTITDVVISLRQGRFLGIEGTWMEYWRLPLLL